MSEFENMGRSRLIAEIERLQSFKTAYMEWSDKTEWVQDSVTGKELGKHRADAIKDRMDALKAENEILRKALTTIREESHDIGACECAADALIDSRK